MGKVQRREELFARQAERSGGRIVYVNQVGGNDELIFDGSSSVFGPDGELLGRAKSFAEDLLIVDVESEPDRVGPATLRDGHASPAVGNGPADTAGLAEERGRREPLGTPLERLSAALKLGVA